MGSACCVAAKDRTIADRSGSEVMPRNEPYSPSWAFRWDNRGRVAGEEESSINDRSDNKSHTTVETTYATEGSPLGSSRSFTWKNASVSEEIGAAHSDPLVSKNHHEGKVSRGTPVSLEQSPTKMSTTHSLSSLSASPLTSSQSQLFPLTSLTPSRWARRSPRHHHLLRQVSDSRIRHIMSPNFSISEDGSGSGSPFMYPGWTHNLKPGSHGGSSDNWSNKDRWSFDSESLSFSRERIRVSSSSSSPTVEIQTCGVCSKVLTERSSFGRQKIVVSNSLTVVSVLICGHIYHAECLEKLTPEINKYDPECPVCTFGDKKVLKLSEKDLGIEMGKKLKSHIVDRSSFSMKRTTSSGKHFLRRHFSFGYKQNRSLSDNRFRK